MEESKKDLKRKKAVKGLLTKVPQLKSKFKGEPSRKEGCELSKKDDVCPRIHAQEELDKKSMERYEAILAEEKKAPATMVIPDKPSPANCSKVCLACLFSCKAKGMIQDLAWKKFVKETPAFTSGQRTIAWYKKRFPQIVDVKINMKKRCTTVFLKPVEVSFSKGFGVPDKRSKKVYGTAKAGKKQEFNLELGIMHALRKAESVNSEQFKYDLLEEYKSEKKDKPTMERGHSRGTGSFGGSGIQAVQHPAFVVEQYQLAAWQSDPRKVLDSDGVAKAIASIDKLPIAFIQPARKCGKTAGLYEELEKCLKDPVRFVEMYFGDFSITRAQKNLIEKMTFCEDSRKFVQPLQGTPRSSHSMVGDEESMRRHEEVPRSAVFSVMRDNLKKLCHYNSHLYNDALHVCASYVWESNGKMPRMTQFTGHIVLDMVTVAFLTRERLCVGMIAPTKADYKKAINDAIWS